MELRTYAKILWRRIWLIALIVGVVALYVGYQYYHLRKTPGALTAYRSDITIQIGLQASNSGEDPSYADHVVVAEALADTLVTGTVLSSNEFDTQVAQQIQADMPQIVQKFGANPNLGDITNVGAIGGALSSIHAHSLVTLSATWTTPQGAWAIARAAGEVSVSSIGNYLDYVVSKDPRTAPGALQPAVTARIISDATGAATVPGSSANKQTLLILLLLTSLIISIALAFLADYLDDRIYSKDEAIGLLELPLYGAVPTAPPASRSTTQQKERIPSPVA